MNNDFEFYRNGMVDLAKWIENNQESLNEADTRLRIIDRLLIECLGWSRDNIRSEEHYNSEYADYTMYINHRRTLILEAKRTSIGFTIPAGFDKHLEFRMVTVLKNNEPLKEAIKQCVAYCNERGVEYGAVSNGLQVIIFLAHRNDGIPPLDGKVIIFNSPNIMVKEFLFLWQVLSQPGILEKRLSTHLQENEISVVPLKLSTAIDNYPRVVRRNELQTDLQIVSEVILENVNTTEDIEKDFLRETYCNSGALSQYALVSRSMLSSRYSLMFEENTGAPNVKDAVSKKGLSPEVFSQSLSSKPILLLGDVGAGKSMFINYFLKIEATEIIKKSFTIYVDLGSKAALAEDLRQFFLDDLIRIFLEKYDIDFYENNFVRGVYSLDLMRFAKGIYIDLRVTDPQAYTREELMFLKSKIDNKEEHIKCCLSHISKGWKRQVIIFMDNVDQRDEVIQEQAFFIANEVAANWTATVFLTLRPTTYYKSKKEGALTGYHPKAFTISPPRADEVILKRLAFALKIAQGKIQSKSLTDVFSVQLGTLSDFLKVMILSFENNNQLIEFIDNICYGNIRRAIEYLTTFIGSGHIDTKKILEKHSHGSGYIVSIHEFLRAIIYKEHQYYYPGSTEIVNVYDVTSEPREHFLTPIVLDYLLRNSTTHRSDGFISLEDLLAFLQNENFTPLQIDYAIRRAVDKGLIETEARKSLKLDNTLPKAIRITTTGSYHLQKLLSTFVYIDAIVVDVPIFSEKHNDLIKDVLPIADRINRAIIFLDYFDLEWKKSNFKKTGFSWPSISQELNKRIKEIQQRIRAK